MKLRWCACLLWSRSFLFMRSLSFNNVQHSFIMLNLEHIYICHTCSWVPLFRVVARLKHLGDMLSSACLSAEAVYKVLYWDDHVKSSRCVSSASIKTRTHSCTHTTIERKVLTIVQCLNQIRFKVRASFLNWGELWDISFSHIYQCLTLAIFCDRFFGGMLLLVCLLYVAPVGWVLAGLNSTMFLWNRDFCRG